jgi:hypothetical protein
MTREEALERLEGTWSFEVVGDQVLIRELGLLSAVNAIRRERSVASQRRPVATATFEGAAASGD